MQPNAFRPLLQATVDAEIAQTSRPINVTPACDETLFVIKHVLFNKYVKIS